MAHWAPGPPRPRAAILIFSISASCKRFAFARRFWNHIFTCVSVRRKDEENSALSAILRYCFSRNFFSSDRSCWVVKGVRGLRLGLCFRRLHLIRGGSLLSAIEKENKDIYKSLRVKIAKCIAKKKLQIKTKKKPMKSDLFDFCSLFQCYVCVCRGK